jgi:uncharacterized protein (DUF4415 family)
MKKLTTKARQKQLQYLASMPDERIDTSDIPELTLAQLRRGVRGAMYRPVKRPVTMRIDADIIAWLKQEGRGYQTKANSLLRREMLRSMEHPKRPRRETKNRRTSLSKKAAS